MQVKLYFGAEQAQQVIHRLLELGNSHLSLDYERVIEQANTAILHLETYDFHDAMFLICGRQLNVDAIVAYKPAFFHTLIAAHPSTFAGFNIPILNVGALLNLISETQSTYTRSSTIYAVTPHNRVVKLPCGATPIDFAYSIHTCVGDQCVRALVNGREVPLDCRLKTGDIVEIIKDPEATPDPDWLKFVKTRIAKRAILRSIKRLHIHRGWKQVKQSLGKSIRNYYPRLEQVARLLNRTSVDDLISMVGCGELSLSQLQNLLQNCSISPEQTGFWGAPDDSSIASGGEQNWRIASCCMPLPGDSIVGVVSSPKRPVRIHQPHCLNLRDLAPEKLRPLSWNSDRCQIQLQLTLSDQPDTFRPILNKLVEMEITPDLRSLTVSNGTARATIGIVILSRQHLDQVLHHLSHLSNVERVKVAKPISILPSSVNFVTIAPL
ncbi:TGS domain-containing protein [Egbenema bharatensis]|uniref:TGS domain-containing protein n=1 Tax=Egbenema bharatensis TaxID=3463334 RepID=UPI003A850B24